MSTVCVRDITAGISFIIFEIPFHVLPIFFQSDIMVLKLDCTLHFRWLCCLGPSPRNSFLLFLPWAVTWAPSCVKAPQRILMCHQSWDLLAKPVLIFALSFTSCGARMRTLGAPRARVTSDIWQSQSAHQPSWWESSVGHLITSWRLLCPGGWRLLAKKPDEFCFAFFKLILHTSS